MKSLDDVLFKGLIMRNLTFFHGPVSDNINLITPRHLGQCDSYGSNSIVPVKAHVNADEPPSWPLVAMKCNSSVLCPPPKLPLARIPVVPLSRALIKGVVPSCGRP
jgi:hypothetical protein